MPPNRHSVPHINTPTGSARPSIDSPRLQAPHAPIRSQSASPNRALPPRRNRAALREYYNLKNNASGSTDTSNGAGAGRKDDETSSEFSVNDHSLSDVIESELDSNKFHPDAFVAKVLKEQSLGEVLKTYNSILQEIRGLDAEKKALVYDNYSKLIKATETIGRMRENMSTGGGVMAGTLDPAISEIYRRAGEIKLDLRKSLSEEQQKEAELSEEEREKVERKRKAQEAVRRVLDAPERIRTMAQEGRTDEAKREWEVIRRVLESWKAQGKGGSDVQRVLDEGEAALREEGKDGKS